jgi:hypothetical protein
MSDNEETIVKESKAKPRYSSTKGDADKRKQTSKLNMQKAREAKLAKLNETKEESKYECELPESDLEISSEDELIITKKPKKKPTPDKNDRLDKLESMIYELTNHTKKKSKPKVVQKKTVFQLPPYPIQTQNTQLASNIKQKLLDL